MEPTDSQLIAAALNGEVEAFQVLFERHWRMAVGVAMCVCRDRHLAEDAAQEAFATACRQLATLGNPARFPEWLRTISRRSAVHARRRQPAVVALEVEPAVETSEDSALRRLAISKAIDQLDDAGREVLILRYFSELSHEEIARTLGTTAASVHGRLQRARRKLAVILGPEFSPGESHVPHRE